MEKGIHSAQDLVFHTVSYVFPFSLFVKGGDNPTVVICSNSATFEMKEAETSNSLLLMPDLKDGAVIQESNGRLLKEQRVSL